MDAQQVFCTCFARIQQYDRAIFATVRKRLEVMQQRNENPLLLLNEFRYCFANDARLTACFDQILRGQVQKRKKRRPRVSQQQKMQQFFVQLKEDFPDKC
jgi:hypothetical protein